MIYTPGGINGAIASLDHRTIVVSRQHWYAYFKRNRTENIELASTLHNQRTKHCRPSHAHHTTSWQTSSLIAHASLLIVALHRRTLHAHRNSSSHTLLLIVRTSLLIVEPIDPSSHFLLISVSFLSSSLNPSGTHEAKQLASLRFSVLPAAWLLHATFL